ncbi:hypothetical protein DFH09DRAFT_205045 [Mycena vulgaris]|nr:hypothetical protein DFH09DRAFT_1374547 [Mycena vulgaris]KAJ6605612.1 hypothetical protein DFH09DRAFT_205045 [Mycena vulgaris]
MSTAPSKTTLIPTSKDILLLISLDAQVHRGLNYAFLFNRLPEAQRTTGLIIDSRGRVREVDSDDWAQLARLVADAKDTEGAEFRRYRERDLPPRACGWTRCIAHGHPYGDIIRGVEGGYLHTIYDSDVPKSVKEIPTALMELERVFYALRQKLLPTEDPQTQTGLSSETESIIDALEEICTVKSDR